MTNLPWLLLSLVWLSTGRVLLDELAIEVASREPLGSA